MSDDSSRVRILENIINKMRGDDMTLKQCSLVSRSFHSPSRRNLFFSIDLDTTKKVARLHQLLVASPYVGRDIRELAVTLKQDVAKEWFANDTVLADILGMLPSLNMLSWDATACKSWTTLSPQLQTALVALFRQPTLTTIAIRTLNDFPLAFFHAISSLKKLKLSSMSPLPGIRQLVMLPGLEMLGIEWLRGERAEDKLVLPNLQRLAFKDVRQGQSAALAQQAIDTAADTLEHIDWEYNMNRGTQSSRPGILL